MCPKPIQFICSAYCVFVCWLKRFINWIAFLLLWWPEIYFCCMDTPFSSPCLKIHFKLVAVLEQGNWCKLVISWSKWSLADRCLGVWSTTLDQLIISLDQLACFKTVPLKMSSSWTWWKLHTYNEFLVFHAKTVIRFKNHLPSTTLHFFVKHYQ